MKFGKKVIQARGGWPTVISIGLVLILVHLPFPVFGEEQCSLTTLSAADVVADERREEPEEELLDDEEVLALRTAMEIALEAEELQRFRQARHHFIRAYEIYPHSNVLLSVARVSFHLEEWGTALRGYQQFLFRRPDYEQHDEIRERIIGLEARIRSQEPSDTARVEEEGQNDVEEMSFSGAPRFAPSGVGWLGAGLTVAGLGAMVGGGRIVWSLESEFQQLERARQRRDQAELLRLGDEIEANQTRGRVLLYGGMGLATLGLATMLFDAFLLDRPSLWPLNPAASTGIEIGPGPGQGVVMRWTLAY